MSLKTQKFYLFLRSTLVILVLLAGVNFIFGQTSPPEPPKPESRAKPEKAKEPERQPDTVINVWTNPPAKPPAVIYQSNYDTSEKAIVVDPKVTISLCVLGGNLKINGWDRNEVRVFVNQGSAVGFKVLESDKKSQLPAWIMIVGFDPKKAAALGQECLSGDEIEIDLPRSAAIKLKNEETKVSVNSIRKVVIQNLVGDILLNNISEGIQAVTYEGDIIVEKSEGAMVLQSGTGNIAVSDVSPSETGDVFKAKTNNGAISLQAIEHRQLEINTNSGSIKFTGEILNNGQYKFGTQNGSVLLYIPTDSSCKIFATYGYGSFNSEISLQKVEKSPSAQPKSLSAMMGSGEAVLNFTTYNGSINIKKK
ncbi:MAG: DUF4097 family beta strand repeat-containing protein, partial [Pyrinomonadaceae bacterium]